MDFSVVVVAGGVSGDVALSLLEVQQAQGVGVRLHRQDALQPEITSVAGSFAGAKTLDRTLEKTAFWAAIHGWKCAKYRVRRHIREGASERRPGNQFPIDVEPLLATIPDTRHVDCASFDGVLVRRDIRGLVRTAQHTCQEVPSSAKLGQPHPTADRGNEQVSGVGNCHHSFNRDRLSAVEFERWDGHIIVLPVELE